MKNLVKAALIAAAALSSLAPAQAATIIDTGTPSGIYGAVFNGNGPKGWAAKFTLGQDYVIDSFEAYLEFFSGGVISMQIHADGATPGAVLASKTLTVSLDTSSPPAWISSGGTEWVQLSAGTYWAAVVTNDINVDARWNNAAPTSLGAFSMLRSNSAWMYSGNDVDLSLRVNGEVVAPPPPPPPAVPLPAGGLLLLSGLGLLALRRKR